MKGHNCGLGVAKKVVAIYRTLVDSFFDMLNYILQTYVRNLFSCFSGTTI